QEQGRLNELAYEDQSVRLSFSLSYEALAPAVQQFFASLGAFGGQDFSVEAVAYVNDVPYTEAKDGLRTLYGLSLVQQGEAGRYSLHPLLCDYARPKMDGNVPLERMIEYFVRYAETHQMDYEALEGERDNLLAALEAAFERGQSRLLVRGINAFYHFLDTRGLYDLADLHLARAQEATRSMTPSSGLETVLLHRGQLARHRGNYPQAEALLQEGLGVARQNGDPERISALLNRLGVVESFLGDYAQAAAHMEEGLALARQTGDRQRIIFFLISLGGGAVERGYYSQAEAHFQEGLSLAREIGHQEGTATLLNNLGDVAIRRGDYAQAEAYLKESLDVARQIGHQRIIAVLYDNLGEVALMRGEYARAQVYLRDGLALARQILDQEITCRQTWLTTPFVRLWTRRKSRSVAKRLPQPYMAWHESLLPAVILPGHAAKPGKAWAGLRRWGITGKQKWPGGSRACPLRKYG
ncbi:MAG: tetratricopeptide repeat protein, partial [Anaerolineae bacterium]